MKKAIIFLVLVLVSFVSASTIPCVDKSPLVGIEFDDLRVGSLKQIQTVVGQSAIVTITMDNGDCFDVREVDQTIHNDNFGDRAITVDSLLRVDFSGQDVWGIIMYIGSDTFDVDRHSFMKCFASDGDYIGGDEAGSPYGPEAFTDEQEVFTGPFQYMVFIISRRPFLNYVPRPIDYCLLDPDGENVFVGLIQTKTDEEALRSARPNKSKPTR